MWKFLVSLLVSILFLWFFSNRIHLGGTSITAPGRFFSPFHGFWQQAEDVDGRKNSFELTSAYLTDSVEVLFDERLVPHIFAKTTADAFYAQGYVTAMFRLWQMDIGARATAGRISEVVGEAALAYDKGQRNRGITWAAEIALAKWKSYPKEYALLESYTKGVNDFIRTLTPRDYPLEFKLMGYAPEEWSPYKTALFAKSMASTLNSQEKDLEYHNLRLHFGDSLFNALFPARNPADVPVIPPGTLWDFEPIFSFSDSFTLPKIEQFSGEGISEDPDHEGSNNWALAGARTASGSPILCNDPHLRLTLPSIWYEVQISTDSFNAYGASFPGLHSVIIGWNEHIAWGSTNVGHDFVDWYALEWVDEQKTKYLLDGQVRHVTYREELIKVRGKADVTDSIKYTHWGPVMKEGPHAGLAMRWISHLEPNGPELSLFSRINQAKTREEFEEALGVYFAPAQNFVYADKYGNIGMYMVGRFPLRKDASTGRILDGSKSDQGWQDLIPANHNPQVVNPPMNFVASANQQSTDATYPYHYEGNPYFEDYRGRFINRKLSNMENAGTDEMKSLQGNNYSLKAEEALPVMLAAIDTESLDGTEKTVFETLAHWNNNFDADLAAPLYFDLWFQILEALTWDEIEILSDSMQVALPEDWLLVRMMDLEPQHLMFDIVNTEAREDFRQIARMSFREMVDSLGSDFSDQTWGGYRDFRIVHLANIDGLGVSIDSIGGHGDVLNAVKGQAGPSWRMVVSLDGRPSGQVVYPGGQSGNPGSPWYDSMVDSWLNGKYFPAHFPDAPSQMDDVMISMKFSKD